MTNLDAIDKRRSRRTYLETAIEQEKIKVLTTFIDQYNAEAKLSMRIIEDGSEAFKGFRKSYGLFKGVKTLIALIGKKSDPYLKEKLGYYGESIVLEATKLDLGTCWVGGTFSNSDNVIEVQEDEALLCVITVGHIKKESLKEKMVHRLATRKIKTIDDLYTADCPVSEWFLNGLEAALKAPSANNSKPVKFEYKEGEIKAYVLSTNKFDLMDLGIAKLHFEIATGGRFELGNDAKYKRVIQK